MKTPQTVEELFEDFAGIAVKYWRASGTSDEHKKDTEEMQQIAKDIISLAKQEERERVIGEIEKLKSSYSYPEGTDYVAVQALSDLLTSLEPIKETK